MRLDQSSFVDQWIRLLDVLQVKAEVFSAGGVDPTLEVEVWVLIHNAEHPSGMLLIPNGTEVLKWHDRLSALGYSYSVVGVPSEHMIEEILGLKEMLVDWRVESLLTPAELFRVRRGD